MPAAGFELVQPLQIAKLVAAAATEEKADLIVLGKQAIDDDANQTGQITAALLDWPQATFASKVEKDGDSLKVTREIDGGLETIRWASGLLITVRLPLSLSKYIYLTIFILFQLLHSCRCHS